jgi:hypothetical protein
MSMDPSFKRPGQRVVVYPKLLDKLSLALETRNVGLDQTSSRWPTYQRILAQTETWSQSFPPKILREDDPELTQNPELAAQIGRWIEDAKRVANGNFVPVKEDGPECYSDSDSEGDGEDDSKNMPKASEGSYQMSQEQVRA